MRREVEGRNPANVNEYQKDFPYFPSSVANTAPLCQHGVCEREMVLQPQTFRTEMPIQPLSHAPLLRHEDPLLLLGSCFSEGVGGRLQAAGHDALANPLGTLFSPASIRRATELLADGPAASWDPPRLDERSGLWYTFDAGATITQPTRAQCEEAMAEALAAGHSQLRRSSCLFVTLGSACRPRSKTRGRAALTSAGGA